MNGLPGPAYHFRTDAQWKQVTAAGVGEGFELDPRMGEPVVAKLGCATRIVAGVGDEIVAVDERGRLFFDGIEGPRVGDSSRLTVTDERFWLLAHGHVLQVDRATLQLLFDRPADGVTDMAGDGGEGVWLLSGDRLLHMDSSGRDPLPKRELTPPPGAIKIAFAGGSMAFLEHDRRHLQVSVPIGGTIHRLDLAEVAGVEAFEEATTLDGGEDSFLLRYRRKGESGEAAPGFLLLGPGGDLLAKGRWLDDRAPALMAPAGDDLLALFRDGQEERLLRFQGMADPGGERRMTPLLEPESPSGTWHRADVRARLPERTTLKLRWASTDDPGLARQVEAARNDTALPVSRRLARAARLLDGRWSPPFTYVGLKRDGKAPVERFVFPLHSLPAPFLWVELETRRAAGTAPPEVESLVVIHEAQGLMEELPAIYRDDEGSEAVSPLRRLVGVLEASTQEMDERIGRVAERLDPVRGEAGDLPDLVSLLSLPFHDALSEGMRRAIVGAAPTILAGRGTRAGLLALLRALFPERPIRVEDRVDLHAPMTLGRGAAGQALPSLLSGPSARVPRLGARLILGRTGLCPTKVCDPLTIVPAPEVLVVIPATGGERRRYGEAVRTMAEAMLPAAIRLRLRWAPWRRREGGMPDDVIAIVDSPEPFAVGQGAGLGNVRVGGRRDARLDSDGVTPVRHRLL
jgi:phage tail-like protein